MDFTKTIINAIKYWVNNRVDEVQSLVNDIKNQITNKIDDQINDVHTKIDTKADISAGQYVATATSTNGSSYAATVPSITALTNGVSFIMIPTVTSSTVTPTLNVNKLGSKPIRRRQSSNSTGAVTVGGSNLWLASNQPYRVIYGGNTWIVEGICQPVATDLDGQVQIEKGGTGATTASDARDNLAVYSRLEVNNKISTLRSTLQTSIDTLKESVLHNTYPNYLKDCMRVKNHYDTYMSPYKTSENYRFEIHVPANQESFALVEVKYMGNIVYKLVGFNSTSDEGFSETKFTCSTQASGISLIDLYKYGFDIVYKNASQSIIDPTTIDCSVYMRFCDINAPQDVIPEWWEIDPDSIARVEDVPVIEYFTPEDIDIMCAGYVAAEEVLF